MLPWLFAGHLAGDYLFQNKWMAVNKEKKPLPLLVHAAVYSAAVWAASLGAGFPGLHYLGVAAVFVIHVLIDHRRFVRWWCEHVTRSAPSENLRMITDQTWHIVALAVVAYVF